MCGPRNGVPACSGLLNSCVYDMISHTQYAIHGYLSYEQPLSSDAQLVFGEIAREKCRGKFSEGESGGLFGENCPGSFPRKMSENFLRGKCQGVCSGGISGYFSQGMSEEFLKKCPGEEYPGFCFVWGNFPKDFFA